MSSGVPAAVRIPDPYREFRDELLAARLLVATSVPGLYLRSERFESVVRGIDAAVTRAGAGTATETLHFPLVIARDALERTSYPRSFPDLTGVVSGFAGGESRHVELIDAFDGPRRQDWTDLLTPTELALCSAACHPLYPTQTGTLPVGGRVVEVFGQCFRNEPSVDPARMQAFRQHEFVYLGSPAGAVEHREAWVDRALDVHRSLGLDVQAVVANDPFFGRAGRMLAANQRISNLKIEIVTPICSSEQPTAISSANIHLDHFGVEFGINDAVGQAAHTACVGFGVERIALALLHTHGLAVDGWPSGVREALGL